MPCAPGTSYNQRDCQCTVMSEYIKKDEGCKSQVSLNFATYIEENKDKSVYVVNENVSVAHGVAIFDGKSSLRVPQLSNMDLGHTVVLKIRYKDKPKRHPRATDRPQALISNGDCGNNASVLLAKDDSSIMFGAETDKGGYTSFSIPSPDTEWKDVTYFFNDGVLEGKVNDVIYAQRSEGVIERRPCALQIGHGQDMDDFEGEMDDIEFFTCKPDDLDK